MLPRLGYSAGICPLPSFRYLAYHHSYGSSPSLLHATDILFCSPWPRRGLPAFVRLRSPIVSTTSWYDGAMTCAYSLSVHTWLPRQYLRSCSCQSSCCCLYGTKPNSELVFVFPSMSCDTMLVSCALFSILPWSRMCHELQHSHQWLSLSCSGVFFQSYHWCCASTNPVAKNPFKMFRHPFWLCFCVESKAPVALASSEYWSPWPTHSSPPGLLVGLGVVSVCRCRSQVFASG